VIVLDTHIWIWWVDENPRLRPEVRERLDAEGELWVCAIPLLEIATAVSVNRLILHPSADRWMEIALTAASVRIEPLSASLCLESTRLPGQFHRDPADRLIVALARRHDAALCTADGKLLAYPHGTCLNADS